MKSRTRLLLALASHIVFVSVIGAQPQNLLTPVDFFSRVSKAFGRIQDYQAEIRIFMEEDEIEWRGSLLYKKPDMLRIDYTEPAEQVLVFNGEKLIFYRPEYSTVFEQAVQQRTDGSAGLLQTDEELSLLRDNYSVAYLVGPDPVPLEEDSEEMVIKLKFRANSTAENFRELEISFDENDFYRRVIGRTLNRTWQVDFTGVVINPGIPDPRFDYKYPANANVYDDFLFEAQE